ncbi:hemolysin XhlA [Mobilisporobacter senegalensis]|uniref:Hemolysin XhlA n=1 Tax=Mobilisporobacter senegalensis TaxID=1329262 RepID=A0A3N1XNV2_9FIRM|nr:hemolysin XhlA family protein [Mobilisporobacter senegalensis]ROR28354.1 hemolysin XhlA [Mobilisporobacter senegalensis]
MDEELIKHRLDVHDTRLNDHSKRLDRLEITQAEANTMIKNLCEKIENQTKAIYWLIGLGATSLLGFFFYAVQQNIF